MIAEQVQREKLDLKFILSKQPILLVDGDCGFCNLSVRFFMKHEKENKRMHFATLDSEVGMQLREYFHMDPKLDSIVLIKGHEAYIKSCAVLRLAPFMKGLWPLAILFVIIPPFIRNVVYDIIAKRRKKIAGTVDICEMLKPEERQRFLDL
jgi:predicted DCC family thiol-disulfide oxidoreductase YuxK